ncbi:SDR family oxidoreductase [Jannaschia sp. M317]|uniref:SDR family oxidoreductase n=1 Tax=Jannaschia sp. M317 TaxID=2867011 RepID=UPI0021A865E5|nr:SDR family oxidoreductase [Jannaschia sp. M317]UWQ18977.1 SDR family NAD(P)-dependent oxidoreductase [Jannaschia sp. M317]
MTRDHNPVAVVAGGTAGVGRATVDALIARGYRVAVLARGEARLAQMQQELGAQIWTRALDVSDGDAVMRAASDIASDLGAPEIWVNSAMLTSFSTFDMVDEAEFRKITDTTYLGTVNGCRAALSVMAQGNIVNVGSGLAYVSVPGQAAYCGAKHAVRGFTQALRIELAREGRPITLSMVQLPAVNTPQFDWARNRLDRHPQPAPPIFQPEVAARGILRAIDQNAREILVGRSVLKLLIGNILFPPLVERQLTEMGIETQKSDRPDTDARDNLDGPHPDISARAHGGFDARAKDDGITLDSDAARKTLAFGGAAALLGLGYLLGRGLTSGSSPKVEAREKPDRHPASPAYRRPTEYRV